MNSLFVCHSEGDSNALFTTAEALLKKSKEHNVFFLIIGNRAKEKWKGLPVDSILRNLAITEAIPESLIKRSETSHLSEKDFDTIKIILDGFIKEHKIINGLVGIPSQNKSGLAFQIAEELTQHFNNKHVFVYNNYLFEEKTHCYWQVINKKVWGEKISCFVPLVVAKEKVNTINPSLEANVVGHPSIDATLTEMPSNKVFVREELGINESEAILFISSSKNFPEDRELLETLFQTLQKNLNPRLQRCLGIHPWVSNPDKYIAEILKKIEEFPSVAQQVKAISQTKCSSSNKTFTRSQ